MLLPRLDFLKFRASQVTIDFLCYVNGAQPSAAIGAALGSDTRIQTVQPGLLVFAVATGNFKLTMVSLEDSGARYDREKNGA